MAKGFNPGGISHWNLNRMRRSAALRRGHAHSSSSLSSNSIEATGQRLFQKLPFYTALKYMAPSLLGLAALKYQGKVDGLFDVNPVPPLCYLGATFGYCLILGTMEQMQSRNENDIRFQILKRAAFAFGLLSMVSLLSIFVPHRFMFLPYIMLTPLPVVLAWPVLGPAYNWLYKLVVKSGFHSICAKVTYWVKRCNFTQEASLPK